MKIPKNDKLLIEQTLKLVRELLNLKLRSAEQSNTNRAFIAGIQDSKMMFEYQDKDFIEEVYRMYLRRKRK
jgi:hypothetical protein